MGYFALAIRHSTSISWMKWKRSYVETDEHGLAFSKIYVLRFPLAFNLRTTYGDHERWKKLFCNLSGFIFYRRWCIKRQKKVTVEFIGRVDDVLKCMGHRIGTKQKLKMQLPLHCCRCC